MIKLSDYACFDRYLPYSPRFSGKLSTFYEREMINLLSTQIKTLRQGKGWTQAELARRLHISPSAIGMYEQGRREPSVDTLVALSKEFDVTMDYLVVGSNRVNLNQKVCISHKQLAVSLLELRSLSPEDLFVMLIAEMLQK